MFIEYFRKRKHTGPDELVYVAGAGKGVILKLGEAQNVNDEMAYQIMGTYPDIVRSAVQASSPAPTRKPRKTKDVVQYNKQVEPAAETEKAIEETDEEVIFE